MNINYLFFCIYNDSSINQMTGLFFLLYLLTHSIPRRFLSKTIRVITNGLFKLPVIWASVRAKEKPGHVPVKPGERFDDKDSNAISLGRHGKGDPQNGLEKPVFNTKSLHMASLTFSKLYFHPYPYPLKKKKR